MTNPIPSSPEKSFTQAAKQHWLQLALELRQDIRAYGKEGETASVEMSEQECRVGNSASGLAVVLTPDFEGHTVRYEYEGASGVRGGTPEGGLLSMRPSQSGEVEFYSADERLTPQQVRRILLDPIFVSDRAA